MPKTEEQFLLEEKYGGEKTEGFFAACKRLADGEPLAYLIGHTPFLNCKIWLGSKPLIPRPETEFWVEKFVNYVKSTPQSHLVNKSLVAGGFGWGDTNSSESSVIEGSNPKILDLCAGSGCIGVAVTKHFPGSRVDFAEIDPQHTQTIQKNLAENSLDPDQSAIFVSDLFDHIPSTNQYDFILSNPPYIDPALDRAEKTVKDFEPHLALYGGTEGMSLIDKIIQESPTHLKPQGQLWLEHEPEQTAAIKTRGQSAGFAVITHKDQYDVKRFSQLVLQ